MKNEGFSLQKRIQSFRYAFKGLKLMISREHNAWIHCGVAVCVLIAGFLLKLNRFEWIIIVFAICGVLVTEAINSAIERLADVVSPHYNKKIKQVKDISAGAVLLMSIGAAIVGLIIFVPKIYHLC